VKTSGIELDKGKSKPLSDTTQDEKISLETDLHPKQAIMVEACLGVNYLGPEHS
jgi:hypothetical protein